MEKLAPIVEKIILPIFKLWLKEVNGLKNLPKDRAFIIAPNHSSYIEHALIAATAIPYLNKRLHIIAKKEHFESITQSFWHSLWKKYVTYIPIDRSKGENALKAAISHLKKGAVLLMYPEGTRTLTGKIQKGKTGIARLVLWSRVPVIPLGIKGTFEILPKGKRIPRFKKATLNFGKLMYFNNYYKKKITKKMLREITGSIMGEIAKLSGQNYKF